MTFFSVKRQLKFFTMSFTQDDSFLQYLHNKVVAIADLHGFRVNLDPALGSHNPNVKSEFLLDHVIVDVTLQKYPKETKHIMRQLEDLITLINFKGIIETDIQEELNNTYIKNLGLKLFHVDILIPYLSYSESDASYEAQIKLKFSIPPIK